MMETILFFPIHQLKRGSDPFPWMKLFQIRKEEEEEDEENLANLFLRKREQKREKEEEEEKVKENLSREGKKRAVAGNN